MTHQNPGADARRHSSVRTALALALTGVCTIAPAAPGTYESRTLTPETALKAAQAALAKCRADGFQVAVAVADRAGVAQVLLRDRYAGAHTLDTARAKAWTAASFRNSTANLADDTQPGKASSGIRQLPGVVAVAGGLVIEAGGSLAGAIGVSGAPGGVADEICARAGIQAISEDLDF